MTVEFVHTLRRLRWQIVCWSAGIALYGLLMALIYPNMADMSAMLDEYLNMFPEAMLAFFENIHALATPMGYLDVYFFSYMHLVAGIIAISAGTGLLAGDEEKGVLDLVLAQPISRTSLFLGRFLGLAAALAIIMAAGWLSWVLPAGHAGLELSWLELLLPFLSLLAILLLFAAVAMLLGLVLPAARIAGMVTGALLVGNYLLLGLSRLNDKLAPLMKYTPLYYYQGGMALSGMRWDWLLGLLLTALCIVTAAWYLFLKRDIRVGGERSWNASILRLFARTS
ncbi:MAG TPA: ABC transporter permease subunit [Firmicutes bacterium]|nr:ABC transporter permease subunit [Bacillota bacterium]